MEPGWAHRESICTSCGEKILPGQKKVSSQARDGRRIRRLRFHIDCLMKELHDWFENNPYEPLTSNGRKPLSISGDNRKHRHILLCKLYNLEKAYKSRAEEVARKLTMSQTVSTEEMEILIKYTSQKDVILAELARPDLGGVPKPRRKRKIV